MLLFLNKTRVGYYLLFTSTKKKKKKKKRPNHNAGKEEKSDGVLRLGEGVRWPDQANNDRIWSPPLKNNGFQPEREGETVIRESAREKRDSSRV